MTEDKIDEANTPASQVTFLEALYGDPLRDETMRTARYLVIASAICTTVVLFKVRLQSTSLIPLDFGDRVDVLAMLLSLAVLLLAVSFCLRAATDLFRDLEVSVFVTRFIEGQRTAAALGAARAADEENAESHRQYLEGDYGGYNDADPWWEGYGEVSTAAAAAVKKAEDRLGLRRMPVALRRLRKALEIGVPLISAFIALLLSRASLVSFFEALFLAFKPYRP